ncbi:MAG: hypothetical protein IKT43_03200 [Clostridia bacterium]|nr:hypothetical protein [Clostridia bacterium]
MALKTRVTALVFALFFLALTLVSCAGTPVISCGKQSYDARLFSFALTLSKTQTLAKIQGTSQNLQDDASIWTTDLGDGSTYADLVLSSCLNTVKMTLFYANYATERGAELSKEEEAAAMQNVTAILNTFSTRQEFDSYMAKYGFDYDLIRRYYLLDMLSQKGMRLFYNSTDTSLTNDDVRAYYEENYVSAIFFYVNETDVLLSNGKTVPLTDEEKAEKAAFFDKAHKQISEGGSFADFMKDSDGGQFEDGKVQTFLLSSVSPEGLRDKLSSMQEDSLSVYQGEKGRYLIYKAALSEEFYEENSGTMTLSVISLREEEILSEKTHLFTQDDTYFNSIDVANLAIF